MDQPEKTGPTPRELGGDGGNGAGECNPAHLMGEAALRLFRYGTAKAHTRRALESVTETQARGIGLRLGKIRQCGDWLLFRHFPTLQDTKLHSANFCSVHLACEETPEGWRAGALVLEKIAGAGGIDPSLDDEAQEESWRTATTLAATLTDRELLDDALTPERLLYRLFHSEGVATDRARALSYGCRCSRARLIGILEGFPTDDLDHMAVDGDIVMTCEFCNSTYLFEPADVGAKTT